jgi:hypothetical protein
MERDLRERTKLFALRIIKLYVALPTRGTGLPNRVRTKSNEGGRFHPSAFILHPSACR